MTTLEAIGTFLVPHPIAESTDAQLRAAGREGAERFVLWSGVSVGSTFEVKTAHVPRQTAYRSSSGLLVQVDGEELHRLNVWLFEHREQLGVQVHSHPTQAFHSDTDDTYPMVTLRGGLSIVVPDFGRAGIRGRGVACYRLGMSGWDAIPTVAVGRLIQFGD